MTKLADHTEQLALATWLDREPLCTCTDTLRGTDTLGCEAHEPIVATLATFWDGGDA